MKKMLLKICSLAMVLTLVACGGSDKATTDDDATTVTFAKENDVISMDSRYATDGMSFEMIAATMEGLMSVDADGNIIPALAEKYEVSEDQLTWTFHLRDTKWSNGKKLTADDFVYAWQETITSPDAEYNYLYTDDAASIVNAAAVLAGEKDKTELGINAVDEKTLEVKLTKAVSFFDSLMTFPVFFPVNREFGEEQGEDYGLTPDNLLAIGPYKMTTWNKGSKIELEKNADYWDADAVKTDKLVFNIVAEASTAVLDFESGATDFVKLNSDLVDKYKDGETFNTMLEGYLWYLQFNFENTTLANANIRKALALAVDRDQLVNAVLKDGSIAAKGFVPETLATGPDGKDYRDTADTYLTTNKEEAKALFKKGLEELGVDSLNLRLLFEGSDPAKPAAEFIQSELTSTLEGLSVEMISQPKENRIEMQKAGDFDVVLTRWGPDYADPTTYLSLNVTGNSYNYGKYSSATYDATYAKAGETEDLSARWQLLKDAEKIAMDDVAVSPLFQVGGATLVNTKVSGIETHAVSVPFIYKNVKKEK
ncbi:MAG: peptide ABC transporter substrate-binding protein [Breznakia sp.]